MLYLTYKPGEDGLGAQFLRIIGIIAVSKKFECEYVHTKIEKMEHLHSLEYLNDIEDYFQISTHYKNVNDITFDSVYYLRNYISNEIITKYKEMAKMQNILLCMDHALGIFDKNYEYIDIPDISNYEYAMSTLRTIKTDINLPLYNCINNANKIRNIAIHIRRGDITNISYTYVPISYYINLLDNLRSLYPNSRYFIFTEINSNNQHEFDDLQKKNQDLILMNDIDILTTMEYMIKADVLVITKSCFSYVAGLYNMNTVYYQSFHHSKLPRWNNIEVLET